MTLQAWAEQARDRRLAAWLERTGADAVGAAEVWRTVADGDPSVAARLRRLLRGDWRQGDRAVFADDIAGAEDSAGCVRRADRLRAMARVATRSSADRPPRLAPLPALARHNLLRRALHRYRQAYVQAPLELDVLERARIVQQMSGLEDELMQLQLAGLFTFEETDERGEFVIARGDWRVVDGRLVGTAGPAGIASTATLRTAFTTVDTVMLRCGISSAAGLNFRLAIGSYNALFNWEMADQNMVFIGDVSVVVPGREFTAHKVHDIRVRQLGPFVVTFVDGVEICRHTGALGDGTVSIYPALHSEVFVECLGILGTVDRAASSVVEPSHRCR